MARIANRQVVQELKEGNRSGCAHLVGIYQGMLVNEAVTVFNLVQEDAEELVSDVLLTVVQRIHDFEFKKGDADFHAWVMTIFKNRVRDLARHQSLSEAVVQRFDERGDDGELSRSELEVIAAVVRQYQDSLRGDPQDNDVAGARLRIVAETLENMESWERVLLRCRALDVPYEDIASYTGKSVKQLKVYHARVKKKFVAMLTKGHPGLVEQLTERK